jgi:segregation and condensation protein A
MFDGEFDELLRLVLHKRILAEDIPLTELAGQLSVHFRRAAGLDLDEVGYLLSVSARLLLLKSAHLLARPVDGETAELVGQSSRRIVDGLSFAAAASYLSGREGAECFSPLLAPQLVEKRLEPRSPAILNRAWHDVQSRTSRARHRVSLPPFVHLESAVSALIRQLRARARVSLNRLLRGSNRNDAVVHFLAVLELVRRRQVTAQQPKLYQDIVLEYVDSVEDEASRAG